MLTTRYTSFIILLLLFVSNCDQSNQAAIVDNVDQVVSVFEQDMYFEQLTHDLRFDIDKELNSLNQSLVLKDLLDQKSSIVVLRISDQNCSVCVEAELEELEVLIQLMTESKTIVLASFENKRGLKILTEGVKKLGVPIFSIPFTQVDLPIEEANIPYYFVLNADWSVSNVFIPKKSFPSLTNSYFAALSKRLSN